MTTPDTTFHQRVKFALNNKPVQQAMTIGIANLLKKRAAAMSQFPQFAQVRARARQIRAHTLSRLDTYLAQFADAVEAQGGHIHWAANAAEANNCIIALANERKVKRIVKSKSMVTEEIELNPALQAAGMEVIETDLGEFIIQLAGERPSHIIAPVMHRTRADVGRVFAERLGIPFTDDPIELNNIARAHLRRLFITADMGISGVNTAVAESGSLCLVTNEGNGRLCTTAPRIHVAVMGMERLVPTLTDLEVILQLLARSATGQKLSVYTSIITGPRRPTDPDGPEELHVILVDNGRSRLLAGNLAEMLYCIRCGACLNHCPVYQAIGGHAYGGVYTGPMGSVLMPGLQGLNRWSDLPHASSLCGKCQEVCPVNIDLPGLLLHLRESTHRAGKTPGWLKHGVGIYRRMAQNPALYRTGLKVVRIGGKLIAKNGWITQLPPPLSGWTDYRAFPAPAPQSFHRLWQNRK